MKTLKAFLDILAGIYVETLYALLVVVWASAVCFLILVLYR